MAKMKVALDVRKSVEENAAVYFEQAKKARKKLEGARAALEKTMLRLQRISELKEAAQRQFVAEDDKRKAATLRQQQRLWYEKFRWFFSSEGFLCIGGRDASTNEIIIKKHTDRNDIVFHTELSGSPFFVVKRDSNSSRQIGPVTIGEAATATAGYSRAWKAGLQSVEVYWVRPEQVSKEAKAGEFISKGAFMIYGKKNYVPVKVELAVGVAEDGKIMGGPATAVAARCSKHVRLLQGDDKPSDAAKKIMKFLSLDGSFTDEVIRALPSGEFKIVR
ncbi:DUF814 domain-containing protein [Candidatus Woesearchaeota archaeon]|nr:DUF814 domain-containing protein [Candidatus Woesearchaeota archaeon]